MADKLPLPPGAQLKWTRQYILLVCEEKGWKPTELAKKIGVSPTTITRFLNDDKVTHQLSAKNLFRISEVSDVAVPEAVLSAYGFTSPVMIMGRGVPEANKKAFLNEVREALESENASTAKDLERLRDKRPTNAHAMVDRNIPVTENLPLTHHDDEPVNVRPATEAPDVIRWTLTRDIAVMGTTECGDDGAFEINNGEPIKYVPRPPALIGIKTVYALMTEGDSMIPAFFPGNLIYVHTKMPLMAGRHVVIQLKPKREGDTPRAYLKTLVSKGAGGYRVKQWHPEKEIVFKTDQVLSVHRVLTLDELLNA